MRWNWVVVCRVAALVGLVALGLPLTAWGQPPATSFDRLPVRVRVGDAIWVTDTGGREHKGILSDLSPSSLQILQGQTSRDFAAGDVALIKLRAPDPLGNGALIGLGVGAAICVLPGALGGEHWEAGDFLVVGLLCGGIGAGIGVGIDAIVPGRKVVVYEARVGQPSVRLRLSPILSRQRQGIAFSIRF